MVSFHSNRKLTKKTEQGTVTRHAGKSIIFTAILCKQIFTKSFILICTALCRLLRDSKGLEVFLEHLPSMCKSQAFNPQHCKSRKDVKKWQIYKKNDQVLFYRFLHKLSDTDHFLQK